MPSHWSKSSWRSTSSSEAGGRFSLAIVEARPGIVVLRATGRGVRALFEGEAGGHRWQRVPPNENAGASNRARSPWPCSTTSTKAALVIRDEDLECPPVARPATAGSTCRRPDSAVQLTHVPSGIQVRCHEGRSQHQNKADALAKLRARLIADARAAVAASRAASAPASSWQRHARRQATHDPRAGRLGDRSPHRPNVALRDYLRGAW